MGVAEGGDRVVGNPVDRNSKLADVWSRISHKLKGESIKAINLRMLKRTC